MVITIVTSGIFKVWLSFSHLLFYNIINVIDMYKFIQYIIVFCFYIDLIKIIIIIYNEILYKNKNIRKIMGHDNRIMRLLYSLTLL